MKIVENMRVKMTKDSDGWLLNLRHVANNTQQVPSAPDGSISLEFRDETEKETALRMGYKYPDDFPQMPAGSRGTILKATLYWRGGDASKEITIFGDDEVPKGAIHRFSMWCIDFDDFPRQVDTYICGIADPDKDGGLPDFLEVLNDTH